MTTEIAGTLGSPNSTTTIIDIYWTDPYSVIQETLWCQILMAVVLLLLLVTGTFLHLGIMFYEKFAEDPQKRSLLNQVLHFLLLNTGPLVTL